MQQVTQHIDPADIAWSRGTITNAVNGLSTGEVSNASLLAQSMMHDASFSAVISKRINNLLQRRLRFIATDKKQERLVEQLSPLTGVFNTQMENVLLWYHLLRLSFGTLEWNLVKGKYIPTINVFHPYHLQYNQNDRNWQYRSHNKGLLTVTPGNGKWFMFGGSFNDMRRSALSALGTTFTLKLIAEHYLSYWQENRSMGLLKVHAPASATPNQVSAFISSLSRPVGPFRVASLPRLENSAEEWDAELMSLGGEGHGAYTDTIEHAKKEYTTFFLGQNLTTEISDRGSYAAAQTHLTIEDRIAHGDMVQLQHQLMKQVVLPYARLNINDMLDVSDLPIIEWDFNDEEREEDRIAKAGKLIELFVSAQSAGIDLSADMVETLRKSGLEIKEGSTDEG